MSLIQNGSEIMIKAALVKERMSVTLVGGENDRGVETQRTDSGRQRKDHINGVYGLARKAAIEKDTEHPYLFSSGLPKISWLILCT